MGVSIELKSGKYEEIRNALLEIEGIRDEKLLDDILLSFGHKAGDEYLLLNNEYYEEYNSYYGLSEFIDRYYGVEDSFNVFLRRMNEVSCNQNVYDVADGLGVELPEEDDE